ncbi:FAD/FMN-containing dehydrogenase [Monaibacterium marinum]|uniref:FAD/FMN-containing dehydrogenase n=1 Tax=Pontivivens marinum TaxID=1690039 RepID=A0A2C9CUU1_9RHOB|nr:FAD-binding oxidoreductase [Monaibacterium marinum]SOH94895.1 FAD/FMN-containing dehydrogenase [Monaibacterium marinum]
MRLEDELAALLGPIGWQTDDMAGYQCDWLKMQAHDPLGVARPKTTQQVAQVVTLANRYGVSITPQGGNTSLCAAAVPETGGQIILSLSRMNTIGDIAGDVDCVTVDAGVVLASLHDAAADQGLIFPIHLGAEGTAQIGGLIATNAGGSHALRYGMMQDLVLGLEVVLPDGQIWNGLRSVLKDNAGYQLRKLFCGAEGTLGIVTRASLRLFPMPKSRATALLVVDDMDALVNAGQFLRRDLGEFISALEFLTEAGLDLALHHLPDLKFPLESRGAAYVLIEVETTSGHVDLPDLLEKALGVAFEEGLLVDGAIAANDAQRATFWRLREEMPEGQRLEGPQIKHDISVPVACIGSFITRMAPRLDAILPGVRINPFGHLGDGNIHYNLSPPIGAAGFGDRKGELSQTIYRAVEEIGGSLAAEHGLGRSKVNHADTLRCPVERMVMRQLKHALDPAVIMNPGVIVHG